MRFFGDYLLALHTDFFLFPLGSERWFTTDRARNHMETLGADFVAGKIIKGKDKENKADLDGG